MACIYAATAALCAVETFRFLESDFRFAAMGLEYLGYSGILLFLFRSGPFEMAQPPQLELLVSLSPAYWGRGFAREAATALIDFAFESLGWEAVQASADAPNEASLGLMRRLGMRDVERIPGEFGTVDIYRILRDEWSRGAARG
jgi:RimJ/RimL family protein N-acetyltransferase